MPGEASIKVGTFLSLSTRNSNGTVKGTVFAFDTRTGVLVITEPGAHGGVSNVRILQNGSYEILESKAPVEPVDLYLPHVELERSRRREEKALQQAELEASRIGLDVSREAQALYEALVKTMPCAWRGKSIVVLDSVVVAEPYTEAECTIDSSLRGDVKAKATLERVRKVLGAERQRLLLLSS